MDCCYLMLIAVSNNLAVCIYSIEITYLEELLDEETDILLLLQGQRRWSTYYLSLL